MAKNQFTDEYFINLTMNVNERDNSIYQKWLTWCKNSNDKYYIDYKNGQFYTQVRTDKEITIEKKCHKILKLAMDPKRPVDENDHPTEEWMQYSTYLDNLIKDKERILEVVPMSFDEWKNK